VDSEGTDVDRESSLSSFLSLSLLLREPIFVESVLMLVVMFVIEEGLLVVEEAEAM
jgi:hypothetical protein